MLLHSTSFGERTSQKTRHGCHDHGGSGYQGRATESSVAVTHSLKCVLQGGYLAGDSGAPPVHAVSSSLVCLPADDAGGPGPRLESWAFALDEAGLGAAIEGGVFVVRGCKLCRDADSGVVVGGEYGITTSMFKVRVRVCGTVCVVVGAWLCARDSTHCRQQE